jgi:hypothetical protein
MIPICLDHKIVLLDLLQIEHKRTNNQNCVSSAISSLRKKESHPFSVRSLAHEKLFSVTNASKIFAINVAQISHTWWDLKIKKYQFVINVLTRNKTTTR